MEESLLTIGVFARRSRLSLKALRLYDRLGLLVPAEVDAASGYRRYAEGQLEDARLIAQLRRLDMPLAEAARVLAAGAAERAAVLAAYWAEVEQRFTGQRELAAHLRNGITGGEEGYAMYEVQVREVPEQIVLTEQRHVKPEELPEWLPAATMRLIEAARSHGGPAGPDFVIYHGEVTEDSDGPAEVCVPIAAEGVPGHAAARIEPAHREAYTRIKKAQVDYPQIISAYDAVEQWLGKQGLSIAGPCREVYFTDFAAAGPEDEVCDIAYPVESKVSAPGA